MRCHFEGKINKTIAYKGFGDDLSLRSVIIAKADLDTHLRYVRRFHDGISPRGVSPLSMSLIQASNYAVVPFFHSSSCSVIY